jgi:hypothetical protein
MRRKATHIQRLGIIAVRAKHRRHIERFTELLSEEVSPRDAAESMGLARSYGYQLMREVRADLGWQAQ